MIAIGVDSGLDGALVAVDTETGAVIYQTIAPTVSLKTRRSYRLSEMVAVVSEIKARGTVVLAGLEKGGVRPGEGPTGAWTVGYGFGLWSMVFVSLGIPLETTTPQAWQKLMYKGVSGEGKDRSILAAETLLPTLDLLPGGRRTKPHNGLADAGLIALYARAKAKGYEG